VEIWSVKIPQFTFECGFECKCEFYKWIINCMRTLKSKFIHTLKSNVRIILEKTHNRHLQLHEKILPVKVDTGYAYPTP